MRRKVIWEMLVLSVAAMAIIGGIILYNSVIRSQGEKGNSIFSLEIPSFIKTANASELNGQTGGTSFLQEEAGISAYTNVGEEINLELAKNAFRTIEYEIEEYIIGSVPLSNYSETEDVHCYVHKDGWIVTYYLREEPTSKIIDWANYNQTEVITGTKLDNGISAVCNVVGVPIGNIKYYDFRYPNANRFMIVADALWEEGIDTFNITLPSDFVFYEISYSHCTKGYSEEGCNAHSQMYIDEQEISDLPYQGVSYGFLSPSQLPPSVTHTIKVTGNYIEGYLWGSSASYPAFDAIVLVYREP